MSARRRGMTAVEYVLTALVLSLIGLMPDSGQRWTRPPSPVPIQLPATARTPSPGPVESPVESEPVETPAASVESPIFPSEPGQPLPNETPEPSLPAPTAPTVGPPRGFDPRLAGRWETEFKGEHGSWTWTWRILPQGDYFWSSVGPIPLPPERGHLATTGGRFTRISVEGRIEEGTYVLEADGTLKLMTPSWTQVWTKKGP